MRRALLLKEAEADEAEEAEEEAEDRSILFRASFNELLLAHGELLVIALGVNVGAMGTMLSG